MDDDSDHHESLARAYAWTLERANYTLSQQQRDPIVRVAPVPVADYSGCKTTKEMTARQFYKWCDDGRPPLTASVATVPKSKVADMVRAAVGRERVNTQASLEALAAIIGEETGKNEKALRDEIDALRTEINEIKVAKSDFDRRAADVLDLPDWRSHHVEH